MSTFLMVSALYFCSLQNQTPENTCLAYVNECLKFEVADKTSDPDKITTCEMRYMKTVSSGERK